MYVRIVGAGLIGASIASGLQRAGVAVSISDASAAVEKLASLSGIPLSPPVGGVHRSGDSAGRVSGAGDSAVFAETAAPELIFVCVPPEATAAEVIRQLQLFPAAGVLDVCSVKAQILEQITRLAEAAGLAADLPRYLGTHPMAGKEISGTLAASADLFRGRPWVICPRPDNAQFDYPLLAKTREVIELLGAYEVNMQAQEHDNSVAMISHTPQLVSTLMASLLEGASDKTLHISGPGVKDVTRLADSDPQLWLQIIRANAAEVGQTLKDLHRRLDQLIAAVDTAESPESQLSILMQLSLGKKQRARIPGKHGRNIQYSQIRVIIPDQPGELVRLLGVISSAGINLEDLEVEHAPGDDFGVAKLAVLEEYKDDLVRVLAETWRVI